MQIINCHTHIFTSKALPKQFLPLALMKLLGKRKISIKIGRFLNRLIPWTHNDLFDKYAAFMNIGNLEGQGDIFDLLKGFYPTNTKFVVLSMDMEYMAAGAVPQPFRQQLNELASLKSNSLI